MFLLRKTFVKYLEWNNSIQEPDRFSACFKTNQGLGSNGFAVNVLQLKLYTE